jgi:branched-chain amino acid transport system substrate-binding protein
MTSALAIEHAGYHNKTDQPTGEMIRDSLRKIANPSGERIGPSQIAQALALLRAGKEINYNGASNPDFGWDANGDVTGIIAYDLFHYDTISGKFEEKEQITQNIALE